jgi:hypothetical protein
MMHSGGQYIPKAEMIHNDKARAAGLQVSMTYDRLRKRALKACSEPWGSIFSNLHIKHTQQRFLLLVKFTLTKLNFLKNWNI